MKLTSATFHTATFGSVANTAPLVPFIPDPAGGTYDTPNDFAGAPWYFEGLPKFIYNLGAFAPGQDLVVNDQQVHNSGVLTPGPDGKPVGATFSFPKPGSYRLVCLLHPGMTGTVVVKAKQARHVPTPAQDRSRTNAQVAAAWNRTKALDDVQVPANTVYMGVGGKETLIDFLPDTQTVPAGTVVTFVNKSPSEPHNAVFGPADWLQSFFAAVDLLPFGPPGTPNQVSPFFPYGSDAPGPGGVYTFTGAAQHGNGVFATPLADDLPGDPPNGLPGEFKVRFTTPGTYHFICELHGPDMAADIVVTPATG